VYKGNSPSKPHTDIQRELSAQAREKRVTVLLKTILTANVDQLVSAGEWRIGIKAAVEGMIRSSANNPGTRTLQHSSL